MSTVIIIMMNVASDQMWVYIVHATISITIDLNRKDYAVTSLLFSFALTFIFLDVEMSICTHAEKLRSFVLFRGSQRVLTFF